MSERTLAVSRPYSKSKVELTSKKSNSMTQKISFVFLSFFFVLKARLQVLEFDFCQNMLG